MPVPPRARVSRRLALLIAVGVVLVLGLGWALDGLAQLAPATRFTNGQAQQAGRYRVALALDPNPPRAGAQARLTVRVADVRGDAVTAATVALMLRMTAMAMAPVALVAHPDGKGDYEASATFPMSGEWLVGARVTPPDASGVQATFDIAVR